MKYLVRILSLIGIVFLSVACSKRDVSTLVVGMELTYPPFEMTNAEGKPDGISVRLAEALGKELGQPIKIVDVGWDGIIPALRTGKIDLIISSMTKTAGREKSIDFSDPYVTNSLCALVGKDSDIRSIDDLQRPGLRIAVKTGTTGENYTESNLPMAKPIRLDEVSACVLQVIQGKADALIYDQISIYKSWQKHPESTRAILEPIREESWAIGIRKGEDELRNAVNAFLKKFRANKGFDALTERYMAAEKKAFQEQGVPFIFH